MEQQVCHITYHSIFNSTSRDLNLKHINFQISLKSVFEMRLEWLMLATINNIPLVFHLRKASAAAADAIL